MTKAHYKSLKLCDYFKRGDSFLFPLYLKDFLAREKKIIWDRRNHRGLKHWNRVSDSDFIFVRVAGVAVNFHWISLINYDIIRVKLMWGMSSPGAFISMMASNDLTCYLCYCLCLSNFLFFHSKVAWGSRTSLWLFTTWIIHLMVLIQFSLARWEESIVLSFSLFRKYYYLWAVQLFFAKLCCVTCHAPRIMNIFCVIKLRATSHKNNWRKIKENIKNVL